MLLRQGWVRRKRKKANSIEETLLKHELVSTIFEMLCEIEKKEKLTILLGR